MSLEAHTPAQLLTTYADVLDLMRERGLIRSTNNPAGDYAEYLFAKAFGWQLQPKSCTGYDAMDEQGVRYEIKCRRVTPHNRSRQLSAIRNYEMKHFDFVAGLLLDRNFMVTRAAIIPHALIGHHGSFRTHVRAHIFHLRDSVWDMPGVLDVTDKLRSAEAAL